MALAVSGCGDDAEQTPGGGTATEFVVLAGFEEPRTPSPATVARGTALPVPAQLAAAVPADSPLRDANGDLDFNRVGALRIHAVSADRPRAIVVIIPGFGAGAGSLQQLGEHIVESSAGGVEFWAVERRENLLEDVSGMNAAAAAGDAEIAAGYYHDGTEQRGRRYHPIDPADIVFMAEWGIDVLMRDVRAVVQRAHAEHPDVPIYLGGHSFGAFFTPVYAAYDFDPGPNVDPGFADLAGLILLDGGPGAFPPSFSAPLVSDRQFLDGGSVPLPPNLLPAAFPLAGLRKLRLPDLTKEVQHAFFDFPGLFTPDIVQDYEIDAMRSRFAGNARSPAFAPPATNDFAFATHFDNDFAPVSPLRASLGFAAGGAANLNQTFDLTGVNPGMHLYVAKDLSPDLQRWLDSDQVMPPEHTRLADLANAMFAGATNTWEWYFPSRLAHDAFLVANLDTSSLSAEVHAELTAFGAPALEVTQNHQVALPVLAIRGERGIVQSRSANATTTDDEAVLEPYFASLATPREAIQVHSLPGFYHLDIILAEDNPVVQLIVDFVRSSEAS
jgi:hypothetical protein